jgi:hypothetical protein
MTLASSATICSCDVDELDELDDDVVDIDDVASGRPKKANADAVDERLQAANAATSRGLGRNFILLKGDAYERAMCLRKYE